MLQRDAMRRGEENQRQGGNEIKSRSIIHTPVMDRRTEGQTDGWISIIPCVKKQVIPAKPLLPLK